MWLVITLAKSKSLADQIAKTLETEGILVKIRPVYKMHADEENYYELLVLKAEAQEARELLLENGF